MSKINYFLLLIFQFLFFSLSSQTTIHALIFAGTDDASIGKGNQVSLSLLEDELQRIHKNENGVSVDFHVYSKDKFQKERLSEVRKKLENVPNYLSNDVVFFIFLGHGFNELANYVEYPNLVFLNTTGMESKKDIEENSIHLKEIIQDFQALQPRLLLTYVEACNDNYLNGESPLSFVQLPETIRTASLTNSPEKKVRELFLETSGLVVFMSSKANQPSYVSDTKGGVFTQSFVRALQLETSMSNAGKATFKSIANESEKIVRQISSNYTWSQSPHYAENISSSNLSFDGNENQDDSDFQTDSDEKFKKKKRGFIAWLIAKLAPNKVKKKFRTAYENGDLLSLNMGIPMDDSGDRLRKKMYAKTPVMFFTSEALYWEEEGNAEKALKNYSIAYELYSSGLFSSEDEKLMKRMKDMDKKNLTGIQAFTNYQRWLKKKLGIFENQFDSKIEEEDEVILDNNTEITQLENSIKANRKAIDDIKNQMSNIQSQVDEIDIPRERTVEVKLKNMHKDSKKTLQEVSNVIQKVKKEGLVDNINSEEVVVGDSDALVKFKMGKRKMNSNLRPDVKGYQLGKHCTDDIVNLTNDLMAILLARLDEVPADKRNEIDVKLQITGNADWRGGENTLGIRYEAEDNIDEEYQDRDGNAKNFFMTVTDMKNITNEELAFLRAYCAWQNIQQILNEKGISTRNIQVFFTAIAWPKSEENANQAEGEPDKRGIDISMTINNLFKHYLDRIKELENELEILKEQIKTKEKDIEQIKARIEILEKEIEDAEARKAELENAVSKSKTSNPNSEASFMIQNVREVWNE